MIQLIIGIIIGMVIATFIGMKESYYLDRHDQVETEEEEPRNDHINEKIAEISKTLDGMIKNTHKIEDITTLKKKEPFSFRRRRTFRDM